MAELEAARKASTFDVKKLKPLTVSLMSGQRDDVRRSLLLNIVLSETVFIKWKRERTFWSRNEVINVFYQLIQIADAQCFDFVQKDR